MGLLDGFGFLDEFRRMNARQVIRTALATNTGRRIRSLTATYTSEFPYLFLVIYCYEFIHQMAKHNATKVLPQTSNAKLTLTVTLTLILTLLNPHLCPLC